MTTTDVIRLLSHIEHGASGRPRELSIKIDGNYFAEPKISIDSTGDGCAGAQVCLLIESEETNARKNTTANSERVPIPF